MDEDKRHYETPAIIVEFDLETRASVSGAVSVDPLDNILLSDSLGLDSPFK